MSETARRTFDADLGGRILDLHLLRRLLAWLAPYRAALAASGVLVLVASVLLILQPIVLSLVVIDGVILSGAEAASGTPAAFDPPDLGMIGLHAWLTMTLETHPLLAACLLYAALQTGWALAIHAHRLTLTHAVVRGLADLRKALFAHLEHRPPAFWDRVAVGRVTTRVTQDIEALYEMLRGLGALVGELVPFLVALSVMLAASGELTGLLLLAVPVIGVATALFRRATREVFRRARQSVARLNQLMQENLSGLSVVQLHGREEENLQRYREINLENRRQETHGMTLETLYGALTDSLASLAIAVILYYGGNQVAEGALSVGAVVLFTRYADMLVQPVVALGEQYNTLFRAMASGERVFQALDWHERLHEPVTPAPLPARLRGAVRFEHLDFAYEPGTPVLRDVTLSIAPGERLAIVGPTGSGKSTLIRLLARLYDVPDGAIFVDGIDVNAIPSRELRRQIGVVLQDFHVFAGTVVENITLGDPGIPRERAIEAARTVGADPFVARLPEGYDTALSDRGGNLSQGERQLLAFARVLAADPEILVLDEATASVDPETEAALQRALQRVTADRTAIVIAHRLATVRDADRLLVLVDGRVEAVGSHAELIARSPTYARLHRLQFPQEVV